MGLADDDLRRLRHAISAGDARGYHWDFRDGLLQALDELLRIRNLVVKLSATPDTAELVEDCENLINSVIDNEVERSDMDEIIMRIKDLDDFVHDVAEMVGKDVLDSEGTPVMRLRNGG